MQDCWIEEQALHANTVLFPRFTQTHRHPVLQKNTHTEWQAHTEDMVTCLFVNPSGTEYTIETS